MMKMFRWIALVEGVTNLALFFVAMPLKYIFGNPLLVPTVGMIHGWAWIAYMIAMVVAFWGKQISVMGWVRTTLAGLVPLGTFINDAYLSRIQKTGLGRP